MHAKAETAQSLLASFWNEAWSSGLWAAAWQKCLADLTPSQASWSPPSPSNVPGKRHSIWTIVAHMCFWREDALRRLTDPTPPTAAAMAAGNFPLPPKEASDESWNALRDRFAESQRRIAEALADPKVDTARLRYMLPHDCYHFGQINYIRALLGFAPIE